MIVLFLLILSIFAYLPNTCTNAGLIAVVFDDGPTDYTEEILEIADRNNIPLSFHFTINQRLSGDMREIYRKVVEGGHTLGLRVNPKRDYDTMSYEEVQEDIERQIAGINKEGDTNIKFAKAPEDNGSYNTDVYNVLRENNITQSSSIFSPYTYSDPVSEFKEMLGTSSNKFDSFIIQMHDYKEKEDGYLQDFIDAGKDEGYTFVNLEDCLGDYKPEKNDQKKSSLKSDGVTDVFILPLITLIFYII